MALQDKDTLSPILQRTVEIHLPHMAFSGLSETWLMKELGDLHWSLLASATSVPSDQIVDKHERRLLTSFVRVRYESTVPLQLYGENDALKFQAHMNRFGRTTLFSEIDMAGEAGELRASLMSMFSARTATGKNALSNSQPKGAMLDAIPRLGAMPPLATEYQKAGERGDNSARGEGHVLTLSGEPFAPTGDCLFSTEYEIQPHDDLNGLNLVYFAAYPKIHDACELRLFRDIQRQFGIETDWTFATSVLARDIFYFGNCDLDDRIIFTLSRCRFLEGRRIQLESSFTRKSDGKEIARILTVKQLGEAGEGYARLWQDGLPAQRVSAFEQGDETKVRQLESALVAELAQVLRRHASTIDREASFKTLDINSLAVAEFAGRFEAVCGLPVEPGWLYSDLSPRTLARQLAGELGSDHAVATVADPSSQSSASKAIGSGDAEAGDGDVAIIGLSLRFPGADDPDEFWDCLASGRDLVGAPPADRKDLWRQESEAGRASFEGGFISGLPDFDPLFFKISPREAERMDPQQRILLEEAWKTIENAGYRASALKGSDTGVFVGISNGDYDELLLSRNAASEFHGVAGAAFSVAANRISYLLDFRGPSLAIDTACSSSLVAVHQAIRAIRSGECSLALAGGVNVNCTERRFLAFAGAGMLSPDWRCKTFDKTANGYVRGEGGAFVLLKPLRQALADGDHVYGIILGSAVNHGGTVNTLTTPNPDAQARLIDAAWPKARVEPESIGYLEAHGTGTPLGDPIEISGMKTALNGFYHHWKRSPAQEPHCGVGSVKTNIGHLEAAAGIAGLIKVLLAFEHRTLPATVHFSELNPHIHLKGSPLYIAAEKRAWEPNSSPSGAILPLRAGVSSFGSGGVNAHVALQAADRSTPLEEVDGSSIIVLSAASAPQLQAYVLRLIRYLERKQGAEGVEDAIGRVVADIMCVEQSALDVHEPMAELGLSAFERSQLPSLIAAEVGVSVDAVEIDDETSIVALAQRLALRIPGGAQVENDHGGTSQPRLVDLAYTLQIGRETMEHRLAVVAGSLSELSSTLDAFIQGKAHPDLYHTTVSAISGDGDDLRAALAEGDVSTVARLWSIGHDVDWSELHARPRQRVPLPTYPFVRKAYWIASSNDVAGDGPASSAKVVQAAVPSEKIQSLPEIRIASNAVAVSEVNGEAEVLAQLKGVFSTELGIEASQLEAEVPFDRYGVDSILLVDIVDRFEKLRGSKLDPTIFLEYPTLGALSRHIATNLPLPLEQPVPDVAAGSRPVVALPASAEVSETRAGSRAIAVVGMACRFPGASDTAQFWENLAAGVSSIGEVPASRWDWRELHAPAPAPGKTTSKWGGFVDDVETFDPGFFGIAEQDAAQVDPLIRLVLEVGVEAVCDAGYGRDDLDGGRIGVFVGARVLNYAERIVSPSKGSVIGILQNFIAAHLAQFYNLRGPNLVVDTACSSSLVSIHLACKALQQGEANMALAGGVEYLLDEFLYLMLSEARALSPDGACHTFDESANGFVPGEGCGIVVLKRLDDALADGDRVLAIIEGSAVNNDGRTMGITTPNPAAQQDVIRQALASANADPDSLSYVEAHGTGTMIGDPIEIKALTSVLGGASDEKGFCAVGSVKSNFGHLLSAAGVASLIKVVLSLQHRQIPPTLHCDQPNPRIGFDQSPFYPNRRLMDWTPRQGVRRAGISSFGFGGTNAHVILRGAEESGTRLPLPAPRYSRTRHWLPSRARAVPTAPQPAEQAILALAIDPQTSENAWVARASLGFDNPLIANHLVHDVRVLPGVALIELVCRSLKLWGVEPEQVVLSRVLFEEPVAIAAGRTREIEVRIDRRSSPFAVTVRNRDAAEGPWRANFGCELSIVEKAPARLRDLEQLKAQPIRVLDLDAAYALTRNVSIRHQGFMKGTGRILELETGALAEIELDTAAEAHRQDFHAHPAHLDTATVIPFFRQSGSGQVRPFIPIYVDSFRLHGLLPKRVYVWVKSCTGRNEENDVLRSDIEICDADGRVLCEMTGLALKRIRAAEDIARLVTEPEPAATAANAISLPRISSAAPADDLRIVVERDLRRLFAPALRAEPETIAADCGFYELGLDSVALLTIARQIEERLGQRIYPTLLFEYSTLRSLADHLFEQFGHAWRQTSETSALETKSPPLPPVSREIPADDLRLAVERDLRGMFAPLLGSGPETIDADRGFYELGLDSVALLTIARQIEERLGQRIYPTLLFEYSTLRSLADHLFEQFGRDWHPASETPEANADPEQTHTRNADVLAVDIGWREAPAVEAESGSSGAGPILVVTDNDHLYATVRRRAESQGRRTLRIQPGDSFRDLGDQGFALDLHQRDDIRRLLAWLTDRDQPVEHILYLAERHGSISRPTVDRLLAMTALSQAILAERFPQPVRIVYGYPDDGSLNAAFDAALEGFIQTLRLETAKVDLQLAAFAPEGVGVVAVSFWAERAWDELFLDGTIPVIRHAGGRRLERALSLAARPVNVPSWDIGRDTVWLITGGLGGLGLIFAEKLAEVPGCRLVLSGRRTPSAAEKARLARLKDLGAQVLWVTADVSRVDDARRLVAEACRHFGTIHGIIHAAGLLRDGMIPLKKAADMRAVLAPKIDGTLNLDACTTELPLEHFILFSSTAAVLGNIGQSDYAFGNAFLDAFALRREAERQVGHRSGRTVSINWPLWRDGGMRADEAALASLVAEKGLSPLGLENGITAFMDVLRGVASRRLVLEGDGQSLMRAFGILEQTPVVPSSSAKPAAAARNDAGDDEAYAIVGVSGRYPKATNLEEFWQNLRTGRDCVDEIPSGRFDLKRYFDGSGPLPGKTYSKWGGFLDQVDGFDPLMFNINPAEAEMMDPQERLFLEATWEVLEDAGYSVEAMRREKVGVFVGSMWNQYSWFGIEEGLKGNPVYPMGLSSSIANRVSYFFDFRGPSFALDTMCSSSLTAIHLACESLRRGECTQAIAGGVNLILHPAKYIILSQLRMVSTDGRCRAFGEGGDGYVPGEGVGAILLKPLSRALEQGDHIHALIRASAINHGGRASGYTVPSVEAQGEVIRAALERAGVDPTTISYVEAHGTGTSLGDPIEVLGLTDSYGLSDGHRVAVGSVKSNLGHLEAAAGIASVTKVLLQMKHRMLAPSLHADTLNPNIDFARSPVTVQRTLEAWSAGGVTEVTAPLRAGVSSFGAGGANAHIVMESFSEAPLPVSGGRKELIVLSARSEESLRASAQRLADALDAPAGGATSGHGGAAGVEDKLRGLIAVLIGMRDADIEDDELLIDYGVGMHGWSKLADDIADSFAQRLKAADLAAAGTLTAIAARIMRDGNVPAVDHGLLPLGPLAYTLQVGRTALPERLALVVGTLPEAAEKLRTFVRGGAVPDLLIGRAGSSAPETSGSAGPTDPGSPDWDGIARSWIAGKAVDWESLHSPSSRRRLPLPTYPFQRKRYWLPSSAAIAAEPAPVTHDPSIGLFTPSWQSAPLRTADRPNRHAKRQTVMVLCRDIAALRDFTQSLSQAGGNLAVIGVTTGRSAERRADNLYAARWGVAEDWSCIFAWMAEAGAAPDAFFVLRTPGDLGTDAALDDVAEQDAHFWFAFSQELMLSALGRRVQGHYLCPATPEGLEPRDLAALAALKSIGWESPDHRSRLVAIEGNKFDGAAWGRHAFDEWALGAVGAEEVIYRDGARFERTIDRIEPDLRSSVGFRPSGTYLITGGMGQLGRRLAEMLVRTFGASVYLAGRAPLDAAMSASVQAMAEGSSGRAVYRSVDITDERAVRLLVDDIAAETGGLNGVLHLARAVEDGLVLQKKPESVARVLHAKVKGSVALDKATADLALDFFLMFSSMAGMFGLRGSADYAFACGFQNGFAAWRMREVAAGRRSGASQALCWSQWEYDPYSNAGRDAQFEQVGFRLIDMEAGFDALRRCLSSQSPALAIVRGDPSKLDSLAGGAALRRLFGAPPVEKAQTIPASTPARVIADTEASGDIDLARRIAGLSDADLNALLARLGAPAPTAAAIPTTPPVPPPPPTAPADAPITVPVDAGERIEVALKRVMTEVLKLDDDSIDLTRPFQDYGVDSVTAVQIAVKLEKSLKIEVPAKLLAAHVTAEQAVREIENQSSPPHVVS